MAASAMYHLACRTAGSTAAGIVAGSVEGFALVARQYLTLERRPATTPAGWPSGRRTSASWRTPTR